VSGPGSRPRVLLLQHAIYPYRRPVFEELARSLDLTVLFCVRSKAFRRWETADMLESTAFRARVLPHLRAGPIVVNRGLLGELRRGRFDAVVVGVIDLITLPQVLVLLVAAAVRRTPVVVCEEFFPTSWYLRSRPVVARVALAVRRFVYRRAAAFATWNPKASAYLAECGVPPDRVFSGPHFYPVEQPATNSGLQAGPGTRELVSISYLLPRKGLDVLIRAFRAVEGDAALVIAGSGEHERALRATAEGDGRIRFVGHVDGARKAELLAGAYALVLPTLWDPWGLVVNEALAYGVPVVVTDAAGTSACIDGAGIVVPAGDEAALAGALRRLLEDPPLRDELARRAPEVLASWTLEAQCGALEAAVRRALGGAGG